MSWVKSHLTIAGVVVLTVVFVLPIMAANIKEIIDGKGHLQFSGGTPTVECFGGENPVASIHGTDNAGFIGVLIGEPIECVLHFNRFYNTEPSCVVSNTANSLRVLTTVDRDGSGNILDSGIRIRTVDGAGLEGAIYYQCVSLDNL